MVSLPFLVFSVQLWATFCSARLILRVPANLPPLPSSSRAILSAPGQSISAPLSVRNTFEFDEAIPIGTYDINVSCRDWAFERGLLLEIHPPKDDARQSRQHPSSMTISRPIRGGWDRNVLEEAENGNEATIDMRLLSRREFYDQRQGFNPISFLQSPMILIAVVGLGFVIAMPYLLDSMDPEMRKEFEEQQKKGVLSGGGNAAKNSLQNFDMAAWMAGKSADTQEVKAPAVEDRGGGSKSRKRA